MTSPSNIAVQKSGEGSAAAFGMRRFGAVNWLGLWTLYVKEVRRFMKVVTQTVIAPVVTTLLYLIVFNYAIGAARPAVGGVPYIEFLTPGLMMMAVLTNAFTNSSSSIMIGKVQGNIVDVLMPPISPLELTIAFVAGAATRGLMVGLITGLTGAAFIAATGEAMNIVAFWAVIFFSTAAALIFGMLGVVGGIWAEKFDNIAAVTNFIIMPLTFLSGTFYSIARLPEAFQTVTHANPVFYMIDGFRYGFTGHAESNLMIGVSYLSLLTISFGVWCYFLFRSGYKLKD